MSSLRAPLRIPAFRRLFAAYWLNGLGDWFGEVALAALVLARTESAVAVALVLVFGRLLPGLVTPLLTARLEAAGSRFLAGLFAAEATLFVLLAVAAGSIWLPFLFSLAALDGILALTVRALTRAANTRVMEEHGCLREGNALMNVAFTTTCACGAALAGIVVTIAGTRAALGLDALSFAVCSVLLAVRCELPPVAVSSDAILERLRSGVRHVRRDALLARLLLCEGVTSVLFALIIPVEIVFVTRTLGGTTADYGFVLAAWGVGMVAGSALVPALQRFRLQALSMASLIVVAVSYLGMGMSAAIPAVTAWSFVGGLGNGVEGFALLTLVQERTPPELQACVNGLLESLHAVAPGLGFLAGGLLTAVVDPRAAYLVSGLGALILVSALGVPREDAARLRRPVVKPRPMRR